MRGSYAGDKLNGIIPSMGIYEFLDKLEAEYNKENNKCNTENSKTEK